MKLLKPFQKGSKNRYPFVVMECGDHTLRLFHETDGYREFSDGDKAYDYIAGLEYGTNIYTVSGHYSILASIGAFRFEGRRYSSKKQPSLIIRGERRKYFPIKRVLDADFEDLIDALFVVSDFLRSDGFELRGTSRVAQDIFASALEEPLQFRAYGMAPRTYRGPRNHHVFNSGGFKRVSHWDINSAYVDALTRAPIPTVFQRDERPNIALVGEGIAVAEVAPKWFPETDPFRSSPIANRYSHSGVTLYTPHPSRVVLPFSELRMVRDYGGRVRVLESHTGENYIPAAVLENYRTTCERIRGLKTVPLAKRILKRMINAGWSTFCTKNNYQDKIVWIDWYGDRKSQYEVNINNRDLSRSAAHSFPVAGIVASRVRQRLWSEVVYPLPIVLCKTDSAFVYNRARRIRMDADLQPHGPIGEEIGEWSERTQGITELIIANNNQYMYRSFDSKGRWVPVVSGPQAYHKDPVGLISKAVRRRSENGMMQSGTFRSSQGHKLRTQRAEWVDVWLLAEL